MKQIGYMILAMLMVLVTILGIPTMEVLLKNTTVVEATNIVYTNEELSILVQELSQHQKNILDKTYPVGRIYMSTSATNPGTIFGGTWVAFGKGRTLVGVDTTQQIFNTVEKTGGAKSVGHSHGSGAVQNGDLSAAVGSTDSNAGHIGFKHSNALSPLGSATYTLTFGGWQASGGFNHFTQVWGDTASAELPTLQPYITVYMWKRTA